MPRVNLVPAEERRREFQRRMYIFPIAGGIVLLGALAGSYYYYSSQLSNTEQDLESFRQLNANQARQVAELKTYEDLKNQRQSRLSAVTGIYQSRFRWSRMLDDMSFVVPEELSLVKITGKVPGAQTSGQQTGGRRADTERDLEFEGYAKTMPDVAVFLVRLGLIPSVTDVTLSLAEVEDLGGEKPVHFIINASLKVGESGQAAAAPTAGETGPSPVTPTGTTGRAATTGTGTTR